MMSELEKQARELFQREIQLDQRLVAALEPATDEDLAEAISDTSVDLDAALQRAAEVPSRTRDQELLRNAISGVRAERRKVLRAIAESQADGIRTYLTVQRRQLSEREARQKRMLGELMEVEGLTLATSGKLATAINPQTRLLHTSETERQRAAIDAESRRADEVAGRPVDSGVCIADDVDDMIRRLVDVGGLYPQLGPWNLAPTFESIREWFAAQEKAIKAGANTRGQITYKLVWKGAKIVTAGNYNVVSGFTVTLPRYVESFGPSTDPPAKGAAVSVVENVPRGHAPKIATTR
jgi:hypothetical protein